MQVYRPLSTLLNLPRIRLSRRKPLSLWLVAPGTNPDGLFSFFLFCLPPLWSQSSLISVSVRCPSSFFFCLEYRFGPALVAYPVAAAPGTTDPRPRPHRSAAPPVHNGHSIGQ